LSRDERHISCSLHMHVGLRPLRRHSGVRCRCPVRGRAVSRAAEPSRERGLGHETHKSNRAAPPGAGRARGGRGAAQGAARLPKFLKLAAVSVQQLYSNQYRVSSVKYDGVPPCASRTTLQLYGTTNGTTLHTRPALAIRFALVMADAVYVSNWFLVHTRARRIPKRDTSHASRHLYALALPAQVQLRCSRRLHCITLFELSVFLANSEAITKRAKAPVRSQPGGI
jgi:hypothetical protein